MEDLENKTRNPCYNYNATTKSIVLEKQIEEAAEIYCNHDDLTKLEKQQFYRSFLRGVKSPEAKAFHQQGMYSEEELNILFSRYNEFIAHHEPEEWLDWIEQNKKK